MPLYVLIGTHLPEVRECILSLHREASDPHATVLWPQGLDFPEAPEGLQITLYPNCQELPESLLNDNKTLFLFIDPRQSLLEEIHTLADLLNEIEIEPTRILTLVDTYQAADSTTLRTWLDAAIHYSDVVLLGNRAQTAKSFVRDYELGYRKRCFPCLFQLLKGKGRPANTTTLLEPDVRRVSQLFDLPDPAPQDSEGLIIEASCDLDADEPAPDPYLSPDGDLLPLPEILAHIVYETP
jgi:hypothetical protein